RCIVVHHRGDAARGRRSVHQPELTRASPVPAPATNEVWGTCAGSFPTRGHCMTSISTAVQRRRSVAGLPPSEEAWAAVRARDERYAGRFLYGVLTTGV